MLRWRRATSRVLALLAGLAFLHQACSENRKAGRAAKQTELCKDYCRLVVRSSNPSPAGDCHRECIAAHHDAGESCEPDWLNWIECEILRSSEPPRSTRDCSEQRIKVAKCRQECRQVGTVIAGEMHLVSDSSERRANYELHFHGCEPCEPQVGIGPGAPCSAAKVCAGRCTRCRSGRSSVSLRACVEGKCADATELTAIGAQLDALAPCRQEP